MNDLKCAICGNAQKTKILYKQNFDKTGIDEKVFSARRMPDQLHYQINKCLNCGLIFSSPILPAEEIVNLYKESKFTYTDEVECLNKIYLFYLKKAMVDIFPGVKLLDIGCGNGFFLQAAGSLGIKEVYGIEPSRQAAEDAPKNIKKNIKTGILKKNIFPDNYFDVITCFHTLDHVIEPGDFLKTTHNMLKKGGTALFVVHDTQGLSVKIFGRKSPIFDVEHIYLFNKSTLSKIFKNNGFKNIRVFDIKNSYPLSYWFKMVPLPKMLKIPVISLLNKSGIGKITFSLKAGNIGIAACK